MSWFVCLLKLLRPLTDQQLVDKDPNGPPVTFLTVDAIAALRLEHLRRDVVRRPYSRVTAHHAFLETEKLNIFKTAPSEVEFKEKWY